MFLSWEARVVVGAADAKLTRFLGEPVMLVAAVADPAGKPAMARALGVRPAADGALDLFISGGQWASVVAAIRPGLPLALTLCRPATYETVQVKGPVLAIARADEAGRAFAERYVSEVGGHLRELGVQDAQMRPWLRIDDLVQVTFTPKAAFEQTPGPRAGQPMASAP